MIGHILALAFASTKQVSNMFWIWSLGMIYVYGCKRIKLLIVQRSDNLSKKRTIGEKFYLGWHTLAKRVKDELVAQNSKIFLLYYVVPWEICTAVVTNKNNV